MTIPARPTPRAWSKVEGRLDGEAYRRRDGATLIWSVAREQDGRRWLHISMAHRRHLPTWSELVDAKEWIAGDDVVGYQVIPARSEWISIHPYALHVWIPLDGGGLPDFAHGGDSI